MTVKSGWWLAGVSVSLLIACACGRGAPGDVPPAAASNVMVTAVGPVPGPTHTIDRPQNPFTDDRGAIAEGRVLFNRFNCSGCHGDHAGGGMGPSLRDVDWIYGATPAQVFSSIAEGRAHGMPAWGTRLSDEQIWKIVAYVKSLRTPLEPEAPQ